MVPGNTGAKPERTRILVVCYGNICRSPMAEALLKRDFRAANMDKRFIVRSAGVGAQPGNPVAPRTEAVARAHGIDLRGHRARRLTADMAREAEVVIALDEIVEEEIAILAGDIPILLWPIDDPYGGPDEGYVQAWVEIEKHVKRYVSECTTRSTPR